MSEEGIQTVRIFLIVSIAILLIAASIISTWLLRAQQRAKKWG
jgi:hypothetical protein